MPQAKQPQPGGTRTDPDTITARVRGTAAAILHAVNTSATAFGLDD